MTIAADTQVLIQDVTVYLHDKGISQKDLTTIRALLFALYLEGYDNGASQAVNLNWKEQL